MITSKQSLGSVVFKLFITLNFMMGPWAYAQEGGQGGRCDLEVKAGGQKCIFGRTAGGNVTTSQCGACYGLTANEMAQCISLSCGAAGAANMTAAIGLCDEGIKSCLEACQPTNETDKCIPLKQLRSAAQAEMTQYGVIAKQAAAVAGATAADGLSWNDLGKGLAIGGALGAVTAGIISATSNKGGGQQQTNSNSNQPSLQPLPTDQTPAEQAGCGTKADAHRYSACNDYYSKNCSTTATDATCQAFFVRYCGTGTAAVGSEVNSLTVDKTGEGMGQTICRNIVAKQYCAVSGRDACPSCQNVNSQSSPSCTDQSGSTAVNPNLCVPQLDQAQKDAAKVTCPTDPLFMNPSFSQVATGTTSGLPQIVIASAGNGWRDVASADSTNLFNVSSATMQSLCAKGKLNCP